MNCNCWRWIKTLVLVRQRGADGGTYGEGHDNPIIRVPRQKQGEMVDKAENMCIYHIFAISLTRTHATVHVALSLARPHTIVHVALSLARLHTLVHVALSLARTQRSMLLSLARKQRSMLLSLTHTTVHLLSHSHARSGPCCCLSRTQQSMSRSLSLSLSLSLSHAHNSPCCLLQSPAQLTHCERHTTDLQSVTPYGSADYCRPIV